MDNKISFDLETIPDQTQGAMEKFIEDSVNNFKAPADMSKKRACEELEVDAQGPEFKFLTKAECIQRWEEHFAPIKAEAVGEENWRKTSFDGGRGQIFSFAFMHEHQMFSYGSMDEEAVLRTFTQSVSKCLKRTDNQVSKPYFIGHNISGFDLRFLVRRLIILGINPGFEIPHLGRHGQHYFDTMIEWCGTRDKIKQDVLCKALGIKGKPDDIDGSKVWDFVRDGNGDRVVEYNEDDAMKVQMMHDRMTFSPNPYIPIEITEDVVEETEDEKEIPF